MAFTLTQDYFEVLTNAVERQDEAFIKKELAELYAADISIILYEMNTDQAKFTIGLLDNKMAADVISYIEEDDRNKFLENFNEKELSAWLDFIETDDAADILSVVPLKRRENILANLASQEKADNILDLLSYEEDSAGGLMAKEFIKVNYYWSMTECIEEIRRQASRVQKIYSVYVVDDEGILRGRVSLKKILLAEDHVRVGDIYEHDIIYVKTYRDQDEVAEIMQKYDLDAIPVVNPRKQLLGRITIDDVVDVITEKAELERQIMTGLTEDIEEDDSIWALSRARLPWLIIGMGGGVLGAQFIGLFEADLMLIPAMAFFIPLITATGGNVGIQSSSIVLQSLADKSGLETKAGSRYLKVFIVAFINGFVISILVFAAIYGLDQNLKLATVVAIALFFVIMLASFMGTITPIVLDKFGVNPALAAGPFITTANDLLGLAVYFTTAHLLYQL